MRKLWSKRGSTVVEVLMAISVLAVGASGVIALQKVSTVANRNARNLEIANEIARTWVERLQSDAMLWNHPSSLNAVDDINDTYWIAGNVQEPSASEWFRPDKGNIHGVHDVFWRDDTSDNRDGPYCANIRLTWLREQPDPGLIRAEVRVYWLRENIQSAADLSDPVGDTGALCGNTASPAPEILAENMDRIHMVTVVTALRKNQPY